MNDYDQHGEGCSEPGHIFGCAGKAGGDHTYRDCWLCHDVIPDGMYVVVNVEGTVRDICDTCMEKADEGDDLTERLDLNREGDPAFNGAFNAW